MPEEEPTPTQRTLGGFAPALVDFTDRVLYGEVWTRPELSPRDRSLVTVSALVAGGSFEQLRFHLPLARDNGVTEAELVEAITHLAFYSGWPRTMSALAIAKEIFGSTDA